MNNGKLVTEALNLFWKIEEIWTNQTDKDEWKRLRKLKSKALGRAKRRAENETLENY